MRNEDRKLAACCVPVILLCAELSFAGPLQASPRFERSWSGRFALAPGGKLAVENVQGGVWVEGWDRAEVEVKVAKTTWGSSDRLDDVRIAIDFGDHSLRFRTLYPQDLDEPIRVDYRLRVPRQVRLQGLRTLQGDILVRDVEGVVDARTLKGNIEQVNVAGPLVASTLAGNIAVSLRALPEAQAPLVLDTLNGNVDLLLPPRPNADLELTAVSGRIEGNYLFEVSSVAGDGARRARVGRGGVRVVVRTVRGNIRVGERNDLA